MLTVKYQEMCFMCKPERATHRCIDNMDQIADMRAKTITETSFLQTEYYERYTQKLEKQIEDQQQLISILEAKLSATRQPSG